MNATSLMLGLLLLGQTGTATPPGKAPAGQRYRNSPAAGAPAKSAAGLPSLPGRRPGRYDASAQDAGAQESAADIPAATQLTPATSGSDLDSIGMPPSRIGAAVGDNPFPTPEGANPLRVADGEVPPARDDVVDPLSSNLNPPLEVDQPQDEIPYTRTVIPANDAAPADYEPRPFVPSGAPEAQDPSSSSFVPAVVDDRVTPASVPADSRLVAVVPPEKETTSDRLLREALTPPELNSLAGKPVTLDELLASHESASDRHATVVRTYWQLCTAVARYHWAQEELQTLEQVTAGRQIPFTANAELAALRAKALQTKAAAVEAQHAMAVYRARPAGTELPLPVDRPVVAAYRTYYESLFANRGAGEASVRQAQRLHETLPLHLEAAKALAESVSVAEDLAQPASNATPQGQLDLNSLVQALRHLHTQREAFIGEVQTYNQSIADYALLSVSPGSSAASLLPMLIKVKPRADAVTGAILSPQWNSPTSATMTPQPSLPNSPTVVPASATETVSPGSIITPNGVIPAGAEFPIDGGAAVSNPNANEKPLRSVLVRSNKR